MISDAELIIMQILWENEALSAKQIIEKIPEKHWSEKTIRTFIHRLVEKGAVEKNASENGLLYRSILTKEEYYHYANHSFLNKMYQGSIKKMILNFVEEETLSSDEIQEIKELLEKKTC